MTARFAIETIATKPVCTGNNSMHTRQMAGASGAPRAAVHPVADEMREVKTD
jgi:hypothetical protein